MSRGDFDIMKEMSANNMDIKCFPPGNLKRASAGKGPWGEVVFAVDAATIVNMDDYLPILYFVNAKQYHELKAKES